MFLNDAADAFEIVTVQSGDRSLRSREFGETFHPVVGPMAEARELHVRQQRLVERAARAGEEFVIWDVGLGAAANAIAVLEAFAGRAGICGAIGLHSFDLSDLALRFAHDRASDLGYLAGHLAAVRALLENGHWAEPPLQWKFHPGDFRETMSAVPAPHAILYDPYSPQANPGMWTLEHFSQLHGRLSPRAPCLLTNYTRSTAVRVTLLLAGFFVGRGHATGEKDETTMAANDPALLDGTLDGEWLERVRRSTNGAPLRAASSGRCAISPEDWSRLVAHPQFGGGQHFCGHAA